ncbi:MAG: TraB/GumN family protein [Hyphomonadaceae bacterium]|nr:TraB/GumN family protein [Hyphomonadaceae bacterium]
MIALTLLARGARALAAALVLAAGACAAPSPVRGQGPAIWRVADADSEIWLFGTVHVLPPDTPWRTQKIDAAFRRADTIVFETDIGEGGRAELQQLYRERGFDHSGATLASKLPPEERERLTRVAQRLGVSEAELAPMRPWFAALQLSLRFVLSRGQDLSSGVEQVLDADATRLKKRRAYLETGAQQIGFLADLPPAAELQFFASSLRQIEEEDESVEAMDQAWLNGETEELAGMLNGLIDEAGPEVREALIASRNRRWTDEIDGMLNGRGKVFVAVGAAHLVGADSVVAQLRARGRRVEGP